MKTVFSPVQLSHDPQFEISDGELQPAVEIPSRAEFVLKKIEERGLGPVLPPEEFGNAPLGRVHTADYLDFMDGFWAKWTAAGRSKEAFPFVWPTRDLRTDAPLNNIDGLLGRYSFDAGTPVGENTFKAAKESANTALTAARLVRQGEQAAFGLCRPPGHHAGADYYGGYSFLNNAAIAAQWLRDQGAGKVAILDVDYHHGNGTQALFYDRADVLFLSLHADPKDEYPYFLGHSDERGTGEGTGFNRNWPLPLGTAWDAYSEALSEAGNELAAFAPDYLVVSLGMDCYENDPISGFTFTSEDFCKLGTQLAGFNLPTVFLMEGGYAVDALGDNCVNVLESFEKAKG